VATDEQIGGVPAREDVEAALRSITQAEPDVLAAYLFGSTARGNAGPLSDIDVAVLLGDAARREDVRGRLTDALSRRLRFSRVDVIDLERAPVPLRYQVLRDGRRILCRDRGRVQRLTAATVLEYLDFKPLRDRAFEVMRAAIVGRGT
jgi:predicted nucleotidyltransferase